MLNMKKADIRMKGMSLNSTSIITCLSVTKKACMGSFISPTTMPIYYREKY